MSRRNYMNRVYKEIEDCKDFSRSCITIELPEGSFKIKCIYDNKYDVYFQLNNNYPFNPPEIITINNRLYNQDLWNISPAVGEKICYHYNISCLFCSSLTCYKNWKPGHTMISIIKEIMDYQNLIKAIYGLNMLSYNNITFIPEVEKRILSFIFQK